MNPRHARIRYPMVLGRPTGDETPTPANLVGATGPAGPAGPAGTTGPAGADSTVAGPTGATGPAGAGDLLAANNLSDVDSAATARTNLSAAAASHTHAGTDIVSGTLAPDRLATGTGLQVVRRNSGNTALEFATVAVGAGDLLAANNLSDVASAADSRLNLGVDIYDVRNYGVVGDGVTDDTSDFQDAIDAAAASTRPAAVYIPGGLIVGISTSIVMPSGCIIHGDGPKSSKIWALAGYSPADRDHPMLRQAGFVLDGDFATKRIYLEGINVEGRNVAGVCGIGVSLQQPAVWRNVRVDDCIGGYGVAICGGTQNGHFHGLQTSGCAPVGVLVKGAQILFFYGFNIESSAVSCTNHMMLEDYDQAAAPSRSQGAAGNVNAGNHQWAVSFVYSGSIVGPRLGVASTVLNVSPASQVNLTSIPLGPAGTIARNVYRTEAGGSVFKLVATIADNTTTTYTDNTADASLGATKTDERAANSVIEIYGSHWESEPTDCMVRVKRGDALAFTGVRFSGSSNNLPFVKIDTLAASGSLAQITFRDVYGNGGTLLDDVDRGWSGTTALTGSITAAAAILTITTGSFTEDDIGKRVTVAGAGAAGALLDTWIKSITSSTIAVLIDAAGTTVAGAVVTRYNALDFRGMFGEYLPELILTADKSPLSALRRPGWVMLGQNKAAVRIGADNTSPLIDLSPATDGTLNPFQVRDKTTRLPVAMIDTAGAVQSLYERFGSGSPEGVVAAPVGAIYHRTDGGTGTSSYFKETGTTTSSGWVSK